MRFRTAIAAIVACFVLAVPAGALAATNPTEDAYDGIAGQQQGGNQGVPSAGNPENVNVAAAEEQGSSGESNGESSSGTLPFTGLEIGLIAIVGTGLLGGGILLYRKNRHRMQSLS